MKLGPGDSTRSHSADEFIYRHEIAQGIEIYCSLLNTYLTQ
jgi:acetylornithine deacetylase